MKHSVRRMTSAFLVVLLCISLLSGVSFAADVNYQTGNPGSFNNVILNWGTRGTTATFLSPNAQAFYEDNHMTYQQLAAQAGASNVSSVPSSQLYKTLQTLMRSNHAVTTSYSATKALYSYTDCQENSRNKMTCFYSGTRIGPDWDGTWNREHTWPNSKGLGGQDENDIMMLRPTDISANSSRGNTAFGESSSFYDPNEESNGVYNLRGDVARIFLYTYVRWGNTSYAWGSSGVMQNKEVLLKWMEEDPVDTWELGRNDSVESITGTRNVFVDYPELAFVLFDEEIPSDMPTPSSEAVNGGVRYTVTATSNNTAWGTVSVSGKTITAVPALGYSVAGYTLISGTAQVTREGNEFTVNASSDCSIRINFEARKEVTVTLLENGRKANTLQVYTDDSCTLPTHTSEIPEGYTFLGWVPEAVNETDTKPAVVHLAGAAVNVAEDTTYYALYSYGVGDIVETGWKLVTAEDALSAGDLVVLASHDEGKVAAALNKQYLTDISATFSADLETITALPDDALIFTLGKTSTGYWTMTNQDGQGLCCNGLKSVGWSVGVNSWNISVNEAGDATLHSTTSSYGRILYNVSHPRFTTYTSSTSATMLLPQLYRLEGSGTILYTTDIPGVGQSVSGTVTSFGATDGTVTVELFDEDALVASVTTNDGTYSLDGIAAGSYTLKISKEDHVTRSYALVLEDSDAVIDAKICLRGDVTGDGVCNTGDVSRTYAHLRGTTMITDEYMLACADVKTDSKITTADVSLMYAHARGTSKLF